jgi:HD-GYP domain-containing protein (c-di-GMP phosphodiesterase class II)
VTVQNENEYEDLLGLWSDLESGLGIILASPGSIQEFEQRVRQYDRWMQTLLQRDTDVGLYLLFQLATNSPVGYSASHSLVCAVLCHLIAAELQLSTAERDSLIHAALTMNIAMTALQDALAGQEEKPSAEQQMVIKTHAVKGGMMLANLHVSDPLWLDVVSHHHDESNDHGELKSLSATARLTRILRIVDRYAAMISPRKSRLGRSSTDSIRSIIGSGANKDEVGHALVRAVGLCPPGTYVRLENNELAVVIRRSSTANFPYVAIVITKAGEILPQPRLHRTADATPKIQAALAASAVRARINHHLVLQLGAYVAQHP